MNTKFKIILCVIIASIIFISIFSCSGSGGGDGKSSCKNCGRSPVYAIGFCRSCYKSFVNYTYGEK